MCSSLSSRQPSGILSLWTSVLPRRLIIPLSSMDPAERTCTRSLMTSTRPTFQVSRERRKGRVKESGIRKGKEEEENASINIPLLSMDQRTCTRSLMTFTRPTSQVGRGKREGRKYFQGFLLWSSMGPAERTCTRSLMTCNANI